MKLWTLNFIDFLFLFFILTRRYPRHQLKTVRKEYIEDSCWQSQSWLSYIARLDDGWSCVRKGYCCDWSLQLVGVSCMKRVERYTWSIVVVEVVNDLVGKVMTCQSETLCVMEWICSGTGEVAEKKSKLKSPISTRELSLVGDRLSMEDSNCERTEELADDWWQKTPQRMFLALTLHWTSWSSIKESLRTTWKGMSSQT